MDTTKPSRVAARGAAPSGTVRRRTGGGGGGGTTASRARGSGSGGVNSGGLWRFYTEDSTGLKIGPVPVLVLSLCFIASVFVLHIWGKFSRSRA